MILDAPVGDKLCGFSFPNNVVIPSGSHTGVKISFESDGSIVYAGFAVSVSFDVDTGNATLPGEIILSKLALAKFRVQIFNSYKLV